jgi:hypothetical protein
VTNPIPSLWLHRDSHLPEWKATVWYRLHGSGRGRIRKQVRIVRAVNQAQANERLMNFVVAANGRFIAEYLGQADTPTLRRE